MLAAELRARRLLALAPPTLLLACASAPAIPVAPVDSHPPPAAAASAPPPPSADPRRAPPTTMPAEIATCDPADDDAYGAWTPTVDDVVAAVAVLPEYCVSRGARANAVRACAAKIGTPRIRLGIGSEKDTTRCWETVVPAEWNGRRWIAIHTFFQNGAQFDGSGSAAELIGDRATLYLENSGLVSGCESGSPPPEHAPADLRSLPTPLAKVLCGLHP